MNSPHFDKSMLLKLAKTPMPFGKYQGRIIIDLPEPYLLWFERKGFPKGEIGDLLHLALEISISGSTDIVRKLKYA